MAVQAKSRANPNHKYGLAVIRDTVQWEGAAVTVSQEALVAALRGVQLSAASASRPRPLDLGAVLSLVHPLAVAEEADGARVRVILLYCRSTVVPAWNSNRNGTEGLCMDVLFVHDKQAAARASELAQAPCPSPQDVYSWLEDNVDELSGRCGHAAYILESGGHLTKKVCNHMISLCAHPSQRPPQGALRPVPLDLAAMPPQPTAATAASAATAGPAAALSSFQPDAAVSYNPLARAPAVAAPQPAAAVARPSSSLGSPRWPGGSPMSASPPPAPALAQGASSLPQSYPAGGQLAPPVPPLVATASTSHAPLPEHSRQVVVAPAPQPTATIGYASSHVAASHPQYRPPGVVSAASPPQPTAAASPAMDPAMEALLSLSLSPPHASTTAAGAEAASSGAGYSAGRPSSWPHAAPPAASIDAAPVAVAATRDDLVSPYEPVLGFPSEGGPAWPVPPPPAAAQYGYQAQ